MNNFISIVLYYSSSNNNVAFAIVENSGNSIDVMAINEFTGQNSQNKTEHLISSVFKNHSNSLIILSFRKDETNQFIKIRNDGTKIKKKDHNNLLKDINTIYCHVDMLNKNEKQALKLAIENVDYAK